MNSQKPPNLISLASLVLLVCSLLTGCNPTSPASTDDAETSKLKKDNQELQEKLEAVKKSQVDAVTLLNDVTDKLADMTGKETEVRSIQNELDPATYEASVDLREQISKDLTTLKSRLEEAKTGQRGLTEAAENNPLLDSYKGTIANLKRLLDEKEQTINSLQAEMDSLAKRAAALEDEVNKGQEKIKDLQQESDGKDTRAAVQENVIRDLRNEISSGYYFSGGPEQIDTAVRRGEIERKWWTYQVPDNVLSSDRLPQSFQKINPEATRIPLGFNLRNVKVRSIHKRYESMFYVAHDGDEWYLRLKEPLAFWRISRYLIVEVR